MRGRLWTAILYIGLANASASGQPNPPDPTSLARAAGSVTASSIMPTPRSAPMRRDIERTNLGWIVLLGLHSLTAPITNQPLPKHSERP